MVEIPLEVAGAETIVRGIFSPYHVNGTKLKWAAFRPPSERRDVSVARHDYLGTEQCRARARAVTSPGEYRGLASLKVEAVRAAGPDVVDSRDQYLGHADIMHSHIPEPHEPPESEAFTALREICKQLARAATFRPDPEPSAETWKGEPI
jgi:hypothetical protein